MLDLKFVREKSGPCQRKYGKEVPASQTPSS